MSEIDVTKYFVIHKDKRGKIFALVQINPEGLFEAITKQNKQLHRYKQAIKEIKEIADENIRIADLEGLNGVYRRGLAKQIIQKCEEVNKQERIKNETN